LDQEQVVDAPSPGQPTGEVVGQTPGVPQEAPKAEASTPEAPAKPVSRRDHILQAAKEVAAKRSTAPAPAGTPKAGVAPTGSEPATNAAGRKIDPATGRFIKADGSLGEQSSQAPQVAKAPRAYPKTWKPELQPHWEKLPQEVLDQIEKREADIFKGIEEYKKQAMPAELRQVIAPYEQALSQQYGSVHAGIQRLFELSNFAASQPEQFIRQFAAQRGINLGATATPETQGDPQYTALQAEIAGLKQQLGSFQQQSQQAAMTPYLSEVERFKSEPGHEKFDELRPHMAALVQSGAAQTLQEAYEQAYRAKYADEWLSAQIAERQKADAERAAQAKQVAVQVTGAPSPSSPAPADPRNRRAVIEAAVRNLGRQ
jgi:hypothetical protein